MIRKFLTSVAVAGLAAGAANALELESMQDDAREPIPLAQQLNFAAGTAATNGPVVIGLAPQTGPLPVDNLVIYVEVAGATFNAQVTGPTAVMGATAVVSTGGAKGGNNVSFSVDGANTCAPSTGAAAAPDAGGGAGCTLTLPLLLDGTQDVVVQVGLETDSGTPIDLTGGAGIGGSSTSTPASILAVDLANAWNIQVMADTATPTVADLAAAMGPFTAFTVAGPVSDNLLGTVDVDPNTVQYFAANPAVVVNKTIGGTDVLLADIAANGIVTVLDGNVNAFDDDVASPGSITLTPGGAFDTIDPTMNTASDNDLAGGAPANVNVVPDGVTPIIASDFTATLTVSSLAASFLGPQTGTGPLQSITRNGTTIVFPWTQTSTLGAASGTTSVYRIGNLDSDAVGEVFVEVANSSEAGFTNAGIMSLAPSIAAGGELVTNSSAVEALLGNYGRGDLIFTIEEASTNLTGRQFVVRGDVIQQVIGGTVAQDQN